jgi:hypothetical protein
MATRGRPLKFGRRTQLLPLTLPSDIVTRLQKIHRDPAWAIVKLIEGTRPARTAPDPPDVELLPIGTGRFLIVVNQSLLAGLDDVASIPLGAGRAFLAFERGRTLDLLELAVLDRLENRALTVTERRRLTGLRAQLRQWRRDKTLAFYERSIVIAQRRPPRRVA